MRSDPEHWRRIRLGDVATLQTGVAKSPRELKDPVQRPYLRVANVQDGRLDLTDVKTIAVERAQAARYELQPGDVLLTEGGDFDKLGRGTVWQGQIDGCLHQNHVFAVRPHRGELLPEFLAAWTASSIGRRYFASCSKQTTNLASVNASQVRAAPLRLPSFFEQEAIVFMLASWEASSDLLDRLLTSKRMFWRGLRQALLSSRIRIDRSGVAWLEHRLGDLFTERVDHGHSQLPLLSITAERGLIRRDKLARRDTSPDDKSSYLRILPGDIGYNTMRMWQGVSALSSCEGLVSPAYTVLVPRGAIDGRFAAMLFKCPALIDRFRRYSQGLVDDTLTLKYSHFSKILVKVPPMAEQRAIADILENLEQEVSLLESLAAAIDRQRRAILDKLLSGELRLPAV